MHQLFTIAFSHYCERGRWALERYGIPYREHRYLPMFHMLPVGWASRGSSSARADRVSSPYSTPLLVTTEGRCLHDSGDILRWAFESAGSRFENLYPTDEVGQIERRLHDELGPHTRRVAYYFCFERSDVLFELGRRNVGAAQYHAFRAAFPMIRRFMVDRLRITRDAYERSVAKVRREVEWLSDRLADGRPFLMGDAFTAADLTMACMLAPAITPTEQDGYGAWLPPAERLPPDARALVAEVSATAAGRLGRRLFHEERRRCFR